MALLVVTMLDNLGKGVVLREIIALHICFVCLVMPLVGYTWFDKSDRLARIFVKYMPVALDVYFGYALPAVSGFIAALCWPINASTYSDKGEFVWKTIEKARIILRKKPYTGLYLLVVGSIMFWVSKMLPGAIQFAFTILFFAGFAGFLYVFYQDQFRHRRIILLVFTIFIGVTALSSGIFTIIAYMSLTLFSFFFLGRKIGLIRKILFFLLGIFILLLIQSVKPAYRTLTWRKHYEGNKAVLFGDLLLKTISNPDVGSADAFFPIYIRTNQGFNVALVMRRFPKQKEFDGGVNLLTSLASSLVPRFLWPDKPEAGGKYNMAYYTGIYLLGWSTNVGPLGEAYGSFGVKGGIVFMIFLGLFIRWAYLLVFKVARKSPLILFWIPVLFFEVTYAAETDTLQILNSLIKSAFLVWIMYKYIPGLFGVEKPKRLRISRAIPHPPVMNPEN
jgi:hypothetical protein